MNKSGSAGHGPIVRPGLHLVFETLHAEESGLTEQSPSELPCRVMTDYPMITYTILTNF
jgi:hypothetical protein